MKKQWRWLPAALAFVVVLAAALLLYRNLSARYAPGAETAPAASEENAVTVPASAAPDEDLAADFTVFDENGAEVRLSDRFGKPLVVNFWASWCGPCCSELPAFDAACRQYAGKVDFMMVNLTDGYSETVESVKAFIAESGYTFPVYYDTNQDAARTYSVYSIPLSVFIRADGTVLDAHIGAMDDATLQGYLAQLLA